MKTTIEIPEHEQHVVRVFTVNLPAEEIEAFNRRNGTWPLRDALGTDMLNAEAMTLFAVSDLAEIGLANYLEDGHGIPTHEVDPIRDALNELQGYVLVLPSSALGPEAQTLSVTPPLKLVATLSEDHPPVVYESLPTLAGKAKLGPAGFDSFTLLPARVVIISAAILATIAIILFTLIEL